MNTNTLTPELLHKMDIRRSFTKATVRYFDHADALEARKWIAADE